MIQIWQFIKNNGDLLIIALVLIFVFILFIRDFDLRSKRSWMILLGLSALGAAVFYRAVKKNKLLKELESREKKLKALEKEYENLKASHAISEENYKLAKASLEKAKKEAALDILNADDKYKAEVDAIDADFEHISSEELLDITKELLKPKKNEKVPDPHP